MPRGTISSAQVSLLGFSGDHVLALLKPCIEQLACDDVILKCWRFLHEW